MKVYFILLFLLAFISCTESRKEQVSDLVEYWSEKKIEIPSNPIFTIQGKDTVDFPIGNSYKILTYIDSIGCTNCKLKFSEWEKIIEEVDSLCIDSVQFLFVFCPGQRTKIHQTLRVDKFKYPVCIDQEDSFNKLNHFPSNMAFQTFLLNGDNKVIAIGNPAHNSKIKDLYLKIIRGEEIIEQDENEVIKTEVDVRETFVSLGSFGWQEEQKATFTLQNTGDRPLVIEGVSTSCGCISIEYSKEPVRAGMNLDLNVTYKAEHAEYFNKTVTIYCNAKASPIKLTISGDAE